MVARKKTTMKKGNFTVFGTQTNIKTGKKTRPFIVDRFKNVSLTTAKKNATKENNRWNRVVGDKLGFKTSTSRIVKGK